MREILQKKMVFIANTMAFAVTGITLIMPGMLDILSILIIIGMYNLILWFKRGIT